MSDLRLASTTLHLEPRQARPEPDNGLSAIHGLANAVLLSVPLWVLIGFAVSAML
jgi:hypothetical protein